MNFILKVLCKVKTLTSEQKQYKNLSYRNVASFGNSSNTFGRRKWKNTVSGSVPGSLSDRAHFILSDDRQIAQIRASQF